MTMPFEPRYKTLVDICETAVAEHAARPLFGTKRGGAWIWSSYQEFGSQVDRVRGGLQSLGVQRGERVAIISNNRLEWAVVAYACYGLGAALVPMYEAQNPAEWEFIVRDCEAKIVFVATPEVLTKARARLDGLPSAPRYFLFDGAPPSDGRVGGSSASDADPRVAAYSGLLKASPVPAIKPSPDDLASLLYTSGTTGMPKGVMLTHMNLASNISAIREVYKFAPHERSLAFLPWAHAFGQTAELHHMIAAGASMAIAEGNTKILENLVEVQPTVLFSVPRVFNRIYTAVEQQIASKPKPVKALVATAFRIKARERAGKAPALHERAVLALVDRLVASKVRARFGGRLRFTVSGGAALSRDVAEFIDSLGILVFEGYGLTETSPVVSVNLPGACKMGTVGPPLPGVRVKVDSEGELVVYGPNVMKGYFNLPEETKAVFTADGGFRTGDMASIDADGFVTITGRLKEQYKLENGKYVVPTPLEEHLKLSPFVANAMVYGDNRPYNVALVVPNADAIQKWAEEKQVSLPREPKALASDERVRALMKTEIDKQNAAFKGFESIRDFALIHEDFTTENGMLTPKMSLKRRKVIETYGALLDRVYAK
jgi:long-chain acyl-CoA synthetase